MIRKKNEDFKRIGPIDYTPKANKTAPQGHEYEIEILLLTLLKSYKKVLMYENSKTLDYVSYIATEMDEAAGFEDVILLEVENNRAFYYFLQSKLHTNTTKNKSITLTLLKMKHGKFSLIQYMEAAMKLKENYRNNRKPFGKIKQELQMNVVNLIEESFYYILYTTWFLPKNLKGIKKINNFKLFFDGAYNNQLFCVDIDNKDPDSLYQETKKHLLTNVSGVTEMEIDEFIKCLIFAQDQPPLEVLQTQVKSELDSLGLQCIKEQLHAKIVKWKNNEDAECLHSLDYKDFIMNIFREKSFAEQIKLTTRKLRDINAQKIIFDDTKGATKQLIDFIEKSSSKIAVLEYDHLLLSEFKIAQVIEGKKLACKTIMVEVKDCMDEIDLGALDAFEHKECHILVATFRENVSMGGEELLKRIFTAISNDSSKKTILIVPQKPTAISDMNVNYKQISDKNNTFSDLHDVTKTKISNEKTVILHNFKINFGKLVDDKLSESIKGQLLINIIEKDIIINTTPQFDKYQHDNVKDYYIPRQLFREVLVKSEIKYLENEFYIVQHDQMKNLNLADLNYSNKDVIILTEENDLVEYESLCRELNENVNVHWLLKKEDELYWQHTQGSLSRIRSHFCLNDEEINLIETDKLFDIQSVDDIQQRVVVICAEPGMGKSSLLSHLEATSKDNASNESHEQKYVVKINLKKEHLRTLSEKPITVTDATDFLFSAMNFKTKTIVYHNFQKNQVDGCYNNKNCNYSSEDMLNIKVFSYLYENNKIAVLVDGYDEVLPDPDDEDEPTALRLLLALKQTKVCKLWVTTVPYNIAKDLSFKLDTVPYNLVPFDDVTEVTFEFLTKYWSSKLELPIDTVKTYVKDFLKHCNDIFFERSRYDSVFVSNPQHLEMIATVYQKYFEKFMETGSFEDHSRSLNIYSLYTKFFDIKFEKCGSWRKDRNRKDHGQFALIELFEAKDLEMSNLDINKEELIKAVERADEKTGIVYKVVETDNVKRARFVHKSFAEYFAADYLGDLLLQNHKQDYDKKSIFAKVQRFLYNNLARSDHHILYFVFFKFLNYKLFNNDPNQEIFSAALNGDFKKIFGIADVTSVRDSFGRTPLHLLLYVIGDSATFFHIRKRNDKTEFPSLLKENSKGLFIPDKLFKWTAVHYFAINVWYVPGEVEAIEYTQDNTEILQDIYGKTPLMLAMDIRMYNINFFISELKYTTYLKDSEGNTILHYFSKCRLNFCDDIDATLIKTLCQHETLFFEKNNDGVMAFDIMLNKGTSNLFNNIENNFFFEECIKRVNSDPDQLVKLISKCKAVFRMGLINNANMVDSKGMTALHHAATYSNAEMVEYFVKDQSVDIDIPDSEGKTPLHHSVENLVVDTFYALLKLGANALIEDKRGLTPAEVLFTKNVYNNEMSQGFLAEIDERLQRNINFNIYLKFFESMSRIKWNRDRLVEALGIFSYIASYFLREKYVDANEPDSEGRTALHFAIAGPSSTRHLHLKHKIDRNVETLLYYDAFFDMVSYEILRSCGLLEFVVDIFDSLSKNSVDNLIMKNSVDNLILKNKTENDVFIPFRFNLRSKNLGKTLMHYAVECGSLKAVDFLLTCGIMYNVPDYNGSIPQNSAKAEIAAKLDLVKALFTAVANGRSQEVLELVKNGAAVNARSFDLGGMQPLHLAVERGDLDTAKVLLENGADRHGTTSVGDTMLHVASKNKHSKTIAFVSSYFTNDEFSKHLHLNNLHDICPLDMAVKEGNLDVVKWILNYLDKTYSTNDFYMDITLVLVSRAQDIAKDDQMKDVLEEFLKLPKWKSSPQCVIL